MNPMIEIIENEDGSITTRELATADLYLFGTIRIPEKVAHIIAFIGAVFIAFLLINSGIELHKKFTQPDPFVSGPGALSIIREIHRIRRSCTAYVSTERGRNHLLRS